MKQIFILIGLVSLVGCTAPVQNWEKKYFATYETNVVKVMTLTNVVEKTNLVEKEVVVMKTNEIGITVTNLIPQVVPIMVYETNLIKLTNMVPVEQLAQSPISQIAPVATSVIPVWGTLISTILLGLTTGYLKIRNAKLTDMGYSLTQEIETVLQALNSNPNTSKMVPEITRFLQSHQVETDVVKQVLTLLEDRDKPQAKEAALDIINAVNKA
jgi:hypothetical protein